MKRHFTTAYGKLQGGGTSMKARLATLSLALAVAAAMYLLVLPVYSGFHDTWIMHSA